MVTIDSDATLDWTYERLAALVHDDPSFATLRDDGLDWVQLRGAASAALRGNTDPEVALELAGVIMRIDSIRQQEIDRRFRLHSDQLDALHRVARTIDDNADRLSQVVTRELCTNLGYGKAMFSMVRGSTWSPVALSVNPALTEDFNDLVTAIDGREISLHDAPREAELVRRRRPYAVDGADTYRRTYRPLIDLSRPAGYLATPVVVGSRVVAIIHVDRQTDDLSESDVHIASALAAMCAVSSERAQMQARIRARNDEVYAEIRKLSELMQSIGATDSALGDAFSDLRDRSTNGSETRHGHALPSGHSLTAREREVVVLMATGATNAAISRKLCISDGTVKSHVQRIFKKLGVSTRAELAALCAKFDLASGE
ncbi:LuxR C-terminal-related transcriptional regulator [Rhodococcus sp. NPDC057297]|uniref:LuxR C-terminal-related transcriptional regulator n=1 Tax=Rhodococcus sp. NPDC057297 TaxID=3346090 RepID=UPI00362CC0DD